MCSEYRARRSYTLVQCILWCLCSRLMNRNGQVFEILKNVLGFCTNNRTAFRKCAMLRRFWQNYDSLRWGLLTVDDDHIRYIILLRDIHLP